METNRVVQLAGVIFCLVLIISEMCYCYPPSYYTSDEENTEQGIREMLGDWERQGLIHSLIPNKAYLPSSRSSVSSSNNIGIGHEIMTRKSPRSNSNSNLRLRYGKRSNMPRFEVMGMSAGGAGDVKAGRSRFGMSDAAANGKIGNWKVNSELE